MSNQLSRTRQVLLLSKLKKKDDIENVGSPECLQRMQQKEEEQRARLEKYFFKICKVASASLP